MTISKRAIVLYVILLVALGGIIAAGVSGLMYAVEWGWSPL